MVTVLDSGPCFADIEYQVAYNAPGLSVAGARRSVARCDLVGGKGWRVENLDVFITEFQPLARWNDQHFDAFARALKDHKESRK